MTIYSHRGLVRGALGMLAVALLAGPSSATIAIGSLTLTAVYPRILTPNGDGFNDKAGFHFDNPEDLPVSGTIFDLSGARVASLAPGQGTDAATFLVWDGKDTSGQKVPGGIYIYEIEYQGKHATGTVAVAH